MLYVSLAIFSIFFIVFLPRPANMVDTMLLLAASVCSCLHKTFIKLSEDIDNGSAIVQLNFQSLG